MTIPQKQLEQQRALGADALLGAEAGSELGPLGILAGGAVGGLIGLGSYLASK